MSCRFLSDNTCRFDVEDFAKHLRPQRGRSTLLLLRELLFNQPMQMTGHCWLIQPLDDFVQEPRDDETLGNGNGNTSGAKIEKLVLFDLARGGAMGAANVVGVDLAIELEQLSYAVVSRLLKEADLPLANETGE